jgi:hypothetical protein
MTSDLDQREHGSEIETSEATTNNSIGCAVMVTVLPSEMGCDRVGLNRARDRHRMSAFGQSGKHLLAASLTGCDPTPTLRVSDHLTVTPPSGGLRKGRQ